jgi:hypothetical protein
MGQNSSALFLSIDDVACRLFSHILSHGRILGRLNTVKGTVLLESRLIFLAHYLIKNYRKDEGQIGGGSCQKDYFLTILNMLSDRKRKGVSNNSLLHGWSLYFSFHKKWSKLGTLLQIDANEAEIKKKFKNVDSAPRYRIMGHNLDSVFCG